jgi:hypothetical protein
MPEDPQSAHGARAPEQTPSSKRGFRILGAIFLVGTVVWQIAQTEFRVAKLRSDGFSDFVIDSTRSHAYFPLIGGILGAALFIGAGLAIKRALRRERNR